MNVETLKAVLLWCAIINYAIVLLWGVLVMLAPGLLHWPRRWFRMSAEQFDAINYAGILLYKIAVLLFNLVPYVALLIVS
jgi:hypothetical protein